jgi:1-acyl-sn-glycerol-3-phosphate acyltransferase
MLSNLWYDFNYWGSLLGFTLGWWLRIEGRGRVPRTGPLLVVGNHESYLDPPAIGSSLPRRAYFFARKTLFRSRLGGAYLRSIHAVPVDQVGVAKEGLKAILDLLGAGEAVVVFPEGERTWTGPMSPFKPGIHLLVKRLPVTILPVGIAGAFESWPRTRKWPRLSPFFFPPNGANLAVAIGRPIPPDHYKGATREQFLDDLFAQVARMRERARQLQQRGRRRAAQEARSAR